MTTPSTDTLNIFNTLVLYEKIPKNRVKNLKGVKIDLVPLDEKKKLDKYTKYFNNEGYRVEYQLPELKNYGRVKQVPYTGLGTFCKEVRGYLAKDIYIDIDMVNCHPVILGSIFKKEGICCEIIEEYINDRSNFLKTEKIEKQDFLIMINKETYGGTGKIKKLHSQIYELLLPKVMSQCPELTNNIKRSKVDNKKGKIIANFLQHKEFQILSELYNYGTNNGLIIDTLMHDGFFVRITETINKKVIEEQFIQKFEELCVSKFEISMKFKVKEHNTTIQIDDNKDSIDSYDFVKKNFEKNHCKIVNKSFFIKELDNGDFITLNEKSLITSYKHLVYQKINDEGEFVNTKFINEWLFDPKMRIYEDIDCFPNKSKCPKNIFNVWKNFEMENVSIYETKEHELKDILNHIKILCNNEDSVYNYFIKWIGQMIKYPEIKTVCPVFISKQGAGKGTLINLLRKMLGNKKILETTDPVRDVYGQFNGQMANSFLININEIGKKDTMDSMGKIKGLITDYELVINTKGMNSYSTNSYHRFIITTNEKEPITTSKDERRMVVIRSSDEKIGDKEYFTKLNLYLEDINVIKTCYEFFKSLNDLDKFGLLPIPSTSHQKNLQELAESPIELWLKDLVFSTQENYIEMTGKESYESFKQYTETNGFKYEINAIKLGVRLKLLGIKGIEKGPHKRHGETKIYNVKEIQNYFNKPVFDYFK